MDDDLQWQFFKFIWILATILGGVFGFYACNGAFAGVLTWLVIGCVAGMAFGFWLPIIGCLALAGGVIWVICTIVSGFAR